MTIEIYTDGASRGNPGQAGVGVAIYKNKILLDTISQFIGIKTNNEAEYTAVIRALERLHYISETKDKIEFYCDSELLVKQMKGIYKVKAEKVKPLYKLVQELIKNLDVNFTWISRNENSLADSLANKGIDEK